MDILTTIQSLLSPFLTGLLIAVGVGVIIGLEREVNTHDEPGHLGGIRTYSLVAVLGYLAAWLGQTLHWEIAWLLLGGMVLLVVAGYYAQANRGNAGITSEVALLVVLFLGAAIAVGYRQESLAAVVVLTVLLSLKERLHLMIRQLSEDELFAFIKFFVMALLVLPMLPDQSFGPEDLLNFREIGWIVVLVLSIGFAGYLLLKFGNPHRGVLWTSVIGGLISSTLIAWIFSARSKERPDLAGVLGAGIVLASTIMVIRVFFLTAIFAGALSKVLIVPLLLLLLASLTPLWKVYRMMKAERADTPSLSPGNPLDVKNALFFVCLYVGVTYLMFGARQWMDGSMTYLSGAVAGIADIDAITISTSKWAASGAGVPREAAVIVLLAILSNSVFKLSVSLLYGSKAMRSAVLLGFGAMLLAGVLGMAWVWW